MTKTEQMNIVDDLIEDLSGAVYAHAEKWPEHWGMKELAWVIEDVASARAPGHYRNSEQYE